MLQLKSSILTVLFFVVTLQAVAQSITQKLTTAFQQFEQDPQLQSAIASLYVVDDKGHVLFQKNATIGLAPASTQKVITSATAYALLGKAFRYTTEFGTLKNEANQNRLYIKGSGDPTLGSWRWQHTKEEAVLKRVATAAPNRLFDDTVVLLSNNWLDETIPGGWIWEDIGNYYGAGAGPFNWRENQYDIYLRSPSAIGQAVFIAGTQPALHNYKLDSKVAAAAKGSGDNAYIYFPLSGNTGVVRGTIPVGENRFVISGAMPNPALQFASTLLKKMNSPLSNADSISIVFSEVNPQNMQPFHTELSPPLDSLIYWFNKKSINLYGEALLKTIGFQQKGTGSTEVGMDVLKSYWKGNGIPETALNLVDGSGLSPLNRVTTQAQATVLQYARKQNWFGGFYHALPEYNGMKLKSGTINGVKGFAGYHTSRAGVSYTISFLVNNYNGSAASLVKKMYAVLDVLK